MKTKNLIFFLLGFLLAIATPALAETVTFKDVDYEAYYGDSVTYMTENGVIKGYSDRTFKPENPISRAEASVLLKRFDDFLYYKSYLTINNVNFEEGSKPGNTPNETEYNLKVNFITSKPSKIVIIGGSKQTSDEEFKEIHTASLQFTIPKDTLPRTFHITIKATDKNNYEAIDMRDYTFVK